MRFFKKLRAKKAARNKITLITGAILGSVGTFIVMKLLGKIKCLCCFKRLIAKKQ